MFTHRKIPSVLKMLPLLAAVALGGCASALSKPDRAAAPEPAEPAMPETQMVMKEVVLDARTTFAFDSAQLTSQGKTALDRLIQEAGGKGAGQVAVTGHTDRIGPEQYNMGLSERRAASVGEYMVSKGVPSDVITTMGRGESDPVVTCEDQNWDALVECLRPNRRVEVEYPVAVEEEVTVEE